MARASADVKRGNATYVYCVVAAPKRPRLTGAPAGLPGTGPLRLLDFDAGRHIVVTDAPLSRYGEVAIRRGLSDLEWVSRAAVAHEAVVEAFIDATVVLPMKLFTLFTSDERAIAHLHGDRRRIDALVKRLANHHEWGVRLVLERPAADVPRSTVRAKPYGPASYRAAPGATSPGSRRTSPRPYPTTTCCCSPTHRPRAGCSSPANCRATRSSASSYRPVR